MASSKLLRVAAIAAIVVIPVSFVVFLARAKWVHQPLPYYGERSVAANGDTIYHRVGDIELIDQDSQKVSMGQFDSMIILANIFFTSCPDVCPEMNKQIQVVAEKFQKFPNIRFLTISIDPANDSVGALKKYAAYYKPAIYKRQFVTGNKKDIYDWVTHDLLLANEMAGEEFIHDDKVVIIDKGRHIRAILPTRDSTNRGRLERIKRIDDDLNNLLYEYRQKELD